MKRALLLLLLAWPAAAKEKDMAWKTDKNDLFGAEVPETWRRKPMTDGPGYLYTDGLRFITAARRKDSIDEFVERRKREDPETELSMAPVQGKPQRKLKKLYRSAPGGDDAPGHSQWIYEETVVLPAKAGFWELRFQSASARPSPPASATAAWNQFLKTFKPAKGG